MMETPITSSTMFAPLLDADPSFRPQWEAFVAEWAGEAELPHYLLLGTLAEHLIARLGRRETDCFDRVFDVVEQWHVRGDDYVSEAASLGLLESLQNQLGGGDRAFRTRSGVAAADFEPWLRPETRRWWEKLYRYWDGDLTALRP